MGKPGFGRYLRLLRINAGLTMTETTKQTGVTQGYISQIENEIHAPSANTLAKLAKAYGVSPLTLMKEAGMITEGHLRTPDTLLRQAPLTSELSRSELESMLRKALNSIGQLTREVETLQRLESVRDGGGSEAGGRQGVVYAPVLSGSLDVVSTPQAPEGVLPVPGELLRNRERGAVLQVSGEELAPDLHPGDLVLVERGRRPEGQGIVAVKYADGVAFQHLSVIDGTMVLTAGNPDFAYLNRLLDASKDSIVLGQVLALIWRRMP